MFLIDGCCQASQIISREAIDYMRINLVESKVLREMANVVGKYVKTDNINFSFFFLIRAVLIT